MGVTFPGESAEYRAARDRLLQSEIELRSFMEEVAAQRRALPPGGVVSLDYGFHAAAGPNGTPVAVRLSELFAPGRDSLVIYSFMFPRDPADDRPGPSTGATPRLPLTQPPGPARTAVLAHRDRA